MPSKIDVLLIDGASDHYLIPVDMLAAQVEVYERTTEIRRVVEKHSLPSSHRVYRLAYPLPRLLDESDL